MLPLVRKVIETFNHYDYHIYKEPFRLNLAAIRKNGARERIQHHIKSPLHHEASLFSDQLLIFYFDENEKLEFCLYEYTTLPFITSQEKTPIFIPNQYKEGFVLKGNLLHQQSSVKAFIDDFKDQSTCFDPTSIQSGDFNMSIGNRLDTQAHHKFKNQNAFQEFLELCQIHITHYKKF